MEDLPNTTEENPEPAETGTGKIDLEEVAKQYEVPPQGPESPEIIENRENIRKNLSKNIPQAESAKKNTELKVSGTASKESSSNHHGEGFFLARGRGLRGGFLLLLSWFFDGFKKSLGATSGGGGAAPKKAASGGHGGGGHH